VRRRFKLQEHAGRRKQQVKQRRKPDRRMVDQRIRRTCERLGSALVALIQERPIDDVTVQEVLDRASVGRSTFYLHYRDKDDLLLSQLEKFLELMSRALSMRKEESYRVVPVEELFAHIGDQKKLYRALADSGRLNDFFDLAQGYLPAGLSSASGNPSVYRTFVYRILIYRSFRNMDWELAPLRWPGACCRCCDGGLTAARKNHHVLWTNCSTGWCGTDSNSRCRAAEPAHTEERW
jgi:AcrR family transcriptional regulator